MFSHTNFKLFLCPSLCSHGDTCIVNLLLKVVLGPCSQGHKAGLALHAKGSHGNKPEGQPITFLFCSCAFSFPSNISQMPSSCPICGSTLPRWPFITHLLAHPVTSHFYQHSALLCLKLLMWGNVERTFQLHFPLEK